MNQINICTYRVTPPKLVVYIYLLLLSALYAVATEVKPQYEPTRESLSTYEVPEWYHDAKIGYFYHWGPHSIIGNYFNKDASHFFKQSGKYKGSKTAVPGPTGQWAKIE